MSLPVALISCALLAPVPIVAQEAAGVERVAFRVTSVLGDGRIEVDRGATDGLAEGDRVFLQPLGGVARPGQVVLVEPRTALVELHDRGPAPQPGTRGEVLVPTERLRAMAADRSAAGEQGASGSAPPSSVPDHPPWVDPDEEWTEDLPLLAQVQAVRPEERAPRLRGRAWAIFDGTAASLDNRTNYLGRVGADVQLENGFDRGGVLRVSGEADYRDTFVEGQVDDTEGYQRFERLSYSTGGTRFEPERWEFGRFQMHGMPEFGLIDGAEYTRRLSGGDSVGGSMGWMPRPDEEMDSGQDFQISAYYRWIADLQERFTFDIGVQKTFHHTTADRDLVVGKFSYIPEEGWDWFGTTWVDIYDGRDVVKDGAEITQAFLSTSRHWESRHGLDITYSRIRFPELQRFEFIAPFDLAGARNDRLALTGWLPTSDSTRLRSQVGVWQDEEDDGGDAELGIEGTGWFSDDGRSGISLVATEGAYSTVFATRLSYGGLLETGSWNVLYEAARQEQEGFAANNDEIYSHWLRLSRDWQLSSGWDISVNADGRVFEEDDSVALGVYLQKRFY